MNKRAVCSQCGIEIKDNEEIYAKMNYPKSKTMVEIKAYLQKKTEITCKKCLKDTINEKPNSHNNKKCRCSDEYHHFQQQRPTNLLPN